jgi:protein-tyrosine-phosphatase
MAEGLAKLVLGHKERIESAGLVPFFEGAVPEAIQVLRDSFNSDISLHRTRNIEDVKLDDFDHIVVLDVNVHEALKTRYPALLNRFILWSIQDPFGKDLESFRKTAKKIHTMIEKHLVPLYSE